MNVWHEIAALNLKEAVAIQTDKGLLLSWEFLGKATHEQIATIVQHEVLHRMSTAINRVGKD